jgi:site-specific DNA recombinase
LVVDKEETSIVQLIYGLFLRDVPISAIAGEANKLGFRLKGNGSIQRILKNPVYCGLILVRAYREYPEELVKGIHTAIIDENTWYRVQERFGPLRQNVQITDNLPLRGVLKCHCGQFLTGAASRGAGGSYYFYYKCKKSGHNNIPANKAHAQFEEVMLQLSLPAKITQKVKRASLQMFDEKVKYKKQLANQQKSELSELDKKLRSLEEKWINNQIEFETYSHWQKSLSSQRRALKMQLDIFGSQSDEISELFKEQLNKLSELKPIYLKATTIQKHQLLKLLFDNRLYYKEGTYRTPFLTNLLTDNNLDINKLNGIIFKKKEKTMMFSPCVHPTRFELISSVPETEILSIELWVRVALSR